MDKHMFWRQSRKKKISIGVLSYWAAVNVIYDVVSHKVNLMHFLVVKYRIWVFPFYLLSLIHYSRLMLKLVSDEDIFAQILG